MIVDKASIRSDANGRTQFILEFFNDNSTSSTTILDVSRFLASIDCGRRTFSAPNEEFSEHTLSKGGEWKSQLLDQGKSELPSGQIEFGTIFADVFNFVCNRDEKLSRNGGGSEDADLTLALEAFAAAKLTRH